MSKDKTENPMDQFSSHDEAQSFILSTREAMMRGIPKDDIPMMSKIYAVFDLASLGAYFQEQFEKGVAEEKEAK